MKYNFNYFIEKFLLKKGIFMKVINIKFIFKEGKCYCLGRLIWL